MQITSTEGRIFAYAPKLQKVLWAANLEISLVGSSHRLEFMDDEQPYLVPTIDGDLAIFSNNAQVFNVIYYNVNSVNCNVEVSERYTDFSITILPFEEK